MTSVYEWQVPPKLVALQIGTARLATWEAYNMLDQALDELRQAGLISETVRRLSGNGCTAICPDAVAAEQVLRRVSALGLDLHLVNPQPGYRESVGEPTEQRGRYVRQSSGPGHFGLVDLRVEPLKRAGLMHFSSAIAAGEPLVQEYIDAVAAGVRLAAFAGGPRGHPLTNLKVTLLGGRDHPVDSRPLSFQLAARVAIEQAIEAVGIVLGPDGRRL